MVIVTTRHLSGTTWKRFDCVYRDPNEHNLHLGCVCALQWSYSSDRPIQIAFVRIIEFEAVCCGSKVNETSRNLIVLRCRPMTVPFNRCLVSSLRTPMALWQREIVLSPVDDYAHNNQINWEFEIRIVCAQSAAGFIRSTLESDFYLWPSKWLSRCQWFWFGIFLGVWSIQIQFEECFARWIRELHFNDDNNRWHLIWFIWFDWWTMQSIHFTFINFQTKREQQHVELEREREFGTDPFKGRVTEWNEMILLNFRCVELRSSCDGSVSSRTKGIEAVTPQLSTRNIFIRSFVNCNWLPHIWLQ